MLDPMAASSFDELKPDLRRTPGREESGLLKQSQLAGREEENTKTNSITSTKHKSDNSLKEENFDSYVPIIKRIEFEGDLGECSIHATKRLKFYDISSPDNILCSKCVLELVVDKNFNSAMTKEEFQKKKQTEDFLNNLAMLGSDLNKIQEKIGRDVEDLEKTHHCQTIFLDNLFSQLNVLINDVRIKYTSRVDKTFLSIKEIFTEKVSKLAKFEREMKELEKDVRLNYCNIIKLMDLDPFYEIIYRYNKKLNNIKSVFTEFKGKPDEIPEDAIRIKSLKSQLGFVSGLSKKIENFFSENDSYDSNNVSQDMESERGLQVDYSAPIEQVALETLYIPGTPKNDFYHSKAIQTEKAEHTRKKVINHLSPDFQTDELKTQAEMLIKSVDTLIAGNEGLSLASSVLKKTNKIDTPSQSQRTSPEFKQSKSITKAEIARRIQAHFNSTTSVLGKMRSNSNTNSKSGAMTNNSASPMTHEKKQTESGYPKQIDFESIAKEVSNRHKSKGIKEKPSGPPQPAQIFLNNIQNHSQYAAPSKHRMSKQASGQQSAGSIPQSSSKDKEVRQDAKALSISKTERILQIYRKNKTSADN